MGCYSISWGGVTWCLPLALYTCGPQSQGDPTLSPDTPTSPFGDCLPVPLHTAPTRRAETVASSMSGELAMILWAARMPVGNRDPSSRPVLASPHHIPRKERWKSHHPG